MKNKNVFITILFIGCFSIPALKAQNIYFSFKNGAQKNYSLSNVRSITFTNDVMNLNKTDNTTDSWNVNTIGNCNYTGFDSGVPETANTALSDLYIYPNPTKGPVNLQYEVKQPGEVMIELIDIDGKLIKSLPQKQQVIGNHKVSWNGMDTKGDYINPGVYFCRISIGSTSISRKIIITNH